MARFVTDSRPISAHHPITEFYREEFVKHHQCLQQQRGYYSERAITDVEAALADFENETGFSIPADVQTLLGDNLLIALSSDGLTTDAIEAGDFEQTSAGVRFTGDAAKLQDLYDRIVAREPGAHAGAPRAARAAAR